MGRYRGKKIKKQRQIIIFSVVCLIFLITVGYAAFSTNITLSAKGNIKDPSRVIQSWEESSTTDFHSTFYKENIVTATFLDTNTVPSNATESWDVSEDGKGGVMAYVTINETETTSESTKYDLFIGAEDGVIANEDSGYLFHNFINLSSIKFDSNFDTTNTIIMTKMFTNCRELIELDLSSFNTQNVTDMGGMFLGADSTSMKIEKIIFGENFVTNNVTSMVSMFEGCSSLISLDLSNFNTNNVSTMNNMFAECSTLTELDVTSFNTENVIHMAGMFQHCTNLLELDLSNFDTRNLQTTDYMFNMDVNLTTIYVSDKFVTTNITSSTYMFGSNNALKGGNGTAWSWANYDKTYARIDTAETPGYFTLKTN